MALVADSCVIRDAVGADWIIKDLSIKTGEQVSSSLVKALEGEGVQVRKSVFASICTLGPDISEGKSLPLADHRDGERRPVDQFPIAVEGTPYSDAQRALFARLVSNTLTAAEGIKDGNKAWASDADKVPLALDETSRRWLRDYLGSNLIWVNRVNNVDVSAAKSFGTGFLTGLVTLVASGGTMASVSQPVDGQNVLLALVDLDEDAVVWAQRTKGVAGRADEPDKFDQTWARKAFVPFYPKP